MQREGIRWNHPRLLVILGVLFYSHLLPQVVPAQVSEGAFAGKEISVSISNDNFWPPFNDQYFTNGIDFSYASVISDELFLGKYLPHTSRISLLRFRLGQELYTPREIVERDVLEFDRPYAAYLYFRAEWQTYWQRRHQLQISVDVGIIGPGAQGEEVQSWWHRIINMDEPRGWYYQIRSGPAANLGMAYRRSWFYGPAFDLSTQTKLSAGMVYNYLQAGIIVRFGLIDILDPTSMGWNRLQRSSPVKTSQWFFLLGYNRSLVWHNTFIEGGIFNDTEGQHTEEAESGLNTIKLGFSFSGSKIDWGITANRLSPEVVGGQKHTYASIELALRY